MNEFGAQWGFCDPDPQTVEECMQQTHDKLIANLGDRRRSGVSWKIWTPNEAILEMAYVGQPIPPDIAALMAEHPDGRVVLALAEAERS